eukprot:943756-Pelagomonas_calceolata.AAC.1
MGMKFASEFIGALVVKSHWQLFKLVKGLAEGVQGAFTGIPNFMVTHLQFADDLSLSHVQ